MLISKGFEIYDQALDTALVEKTLAELELTAETSISGSIRNAETKFAFVKEICNTEFVSRKISEYLPGKAVLVRAIMFDKSATSNWLVTWHQDKTIAVKKKVDLQGWGPWTVKDKVVHVQPPLEVLESMLTVRFHFDRTTKENGCLKVIPRSHELGIVSQSDIPRLIESSDIEFCELDVGGALLMRPNLFHSSSKSKSNKQRRVLHLEFSNYQLDHGLEWATDA